MSKKDNDQSTNDEALLSADESPTKVNRKDGGTGVRSVNNKPLFIAGLLLLVFFLAIGYVLQSRKNEQNPASAPTQKKGSSSEKFASQIAGFDARGLIPAKDDTYTPPPKPKEPEERQESVPQPDKPIVVTEKPQEAKPDPELEAERKRKKQLEMQAIGSPTLVSYKAPTPTSKTSSSNAYVGSYSDGSTVYSSTADSGFDDSPIVEIKQQLAALDSSSEYADGGSSNPNSSSTFSRTTGANGDRWELNSQREDTKSPYVLRAGYVIPGVLLSGMNSELPGQIIGQVSQNVYDTKTGRFLLIPKGSRLIGTYVSSVQYGQSRIMVAWQRIVYPDATAQDIGEMPGADSAGYSGFTDQVDNHYLRIFGSAILLSGITAGITYSQDPGRYRNDGDKYDDRESASDVLSQQLGQVLGNTVAKMVDKNLSIAPTLEIRPGYQFNITVTKDLSFDSPYTPR